MWSGAALTQSGHFLPMASGCDARRAAAYRDHGTIDRELTMLRRSAALAVAALALSAAIGIALHAAAAATTRPADCASKAPIELPVNAWAPARHELAPPGASAIRLCRYNALGVKPVRGLAASGLVSDPTSVRKLVGELDSLPVPPKLAFCPMDKGALIDLIVAYGGGGDRGVLVQVDLTGCATVDNGSVIRTAAGSAAGHALLAQIERLTGYKGPAF